MIGFCSDTRLLLKVLVSHAISVKTHALQRCADEHYCCCADAGTTRVFLLIATAHDSLDQLFV